MLVMIDNYDSFTYNLYQYLMQMGAEVQVTRNNLLTMDELEVLNPLGLVISPGPGRPEEAGITIAAIKRFSGRIPILGVCLGHQAIALAMGGKVVPAKRLMHGKTSSVTADGRELFKGIQGSFQAMRYHSLAVDRSSLPACLEVTAESEDGEIMGIRHRSHPIEGLQFHPESIMTTVGKRLLRNFLNMTRRTIHN
ncbi:MAG: aminodeoxychorismate/anthranilate synthase component II [Desulfobacteraceae bacterium]|nr:MAG: aminodeoxychorismate/anthranilate synthase component II [Desulfobacteraceae bacterium]